MMQNLTLPGITDQSLERRRIFLISPERRGEPDGQIQPHSEEAWLTDRAYY